MKQTKRPSNFSYFELLDACKKPGCPVCRIGHRAAQRHLTSVIYDGVNDVPLRATLRKSYGYCHEHAWLLPESSEGAPLGIAIIHRDILNYLRRQLEDADFNTNRTASIRSLISGALGQYEFDSDETAAQYLPRETICPACERRQEVELLAFASLLEALDKEDQAMKTALGESDGLCIPHLRQALGAARSPQSFHTLAAITSRQLSTLIHDLDEFVRKNDHRFRDEKITNEERTSWHRALERTSGKKRDQEAR